MAFGAPSAVSASRRAKAAKLRRSGRIVDALNEYEAILRHSPDDHDTIAEMAEVAADLELHELAARLWRQVMSQQPGRLEAVDGFARALREVGRFDDAVAALRDTLMAHPEEPRLWNTLAVTLAQQGRPLEALPFFDEALRLEPGLVSALYNRGGAFFDLGRLENADADFQAARRVARKPTDVAMIDFAAATLHLAQGNLERGWRAYEVRLSRDWPKSASFSAPGRRWNPNMALKGKRLLVVAEQGVGDEIMFANLLPDVAKELGSNELLTLAVDPRLVTLFSRSFPGAVVAGHTTKRSGARMRRAVPSAGVGTGIDLWTPLASLAQRFRQTRADFPERRGYLRPDPDRVAHWRGWLGRGWADAGPPVVGLTWRSGKLLGDRRRHYPPLEAWRAVMATADVRFVNLQYGDCADELAALRVHGAADILEPPGLDIRNDLDDLSALCAALDLVVSVCNATGQLAGACGCPLVLLGPAATWPQLGSGDYPWHPHARMLTSNEGDRWDATMTQVAEIVGALGQT